MTIPDFEKLVTDRLFLILDSEIEGLKSVFKHPPVYSIGVTETPLAYVLVGAMLNPIPVDTAGSVTVKRTYVVRILGMPVPANSERPNKEGSKGLVDLLPFIARMRDYLTEHPRLQTSKLAGLAYIYQQIEFTDSGLSVVQLGAGGIEHFAIDFTLTITMRASTKALA